MHRLKTIRMAEVNLDDGSHFLSTDQLARKKRFDLSPR